MLKKLNEDLTQMKIYSGNFDKLAEYVDAHPESNRGVSNKHVKWQSPKVEEE